MSLFEAVERGSVEDVDIALKLGRRIDEVNDCEDALMFATRRRDVAMVLHLLSRGANCRLTNQHGDTALHLACITGQKAIVEALLSHGALLESRGAQLNRPIHLACASGAEDVVATLLLRGCVVNAQNANGALPSTLCATVESIKSMVGAIERDGEPAREKLRREVAAKFASEAIHRRQEERCAADRRAAVRAEEERKHLEIEHARQSEMQRLTDECERLRAEIADIREKEAQKLREEEAKKAKREKAAAKKAAASGKKMLVKK